MKRISMAEQTLVGQIKHFQRQWDELLAAQVKLTTEMEVLETVIGDLRLEQERLQRQRQGAPAQRQ